MLKVIHCPTEEQLIDVFTKDAKIKMHDWNGEAGELELREDVSF